MAVTCAVTVANLYYAQPLLHSISTSLHVSEGSASLLVTAGQLGYAGGLLFIVPAGDIVRSLSARSPWSAARSRRTWRRSARPRCWPA